MPGPQASVLWGKPHYDFLTVLISLESTLNWETLCKLSCMKISTVILHDFKNPVFAFGLKEMKLSGRVSYSLNTQANLDIFLLTWVGPKIRKDSIGFGKKKKKVPCTTLWNLFAHLLSVLVKFGERVQRQLLFWVILSWSPHAMLTATFHILKYYCGILLVRFLYYLVLSPIKIYNSVIWYC